MRLDTHQHDSVNGGSDSHRDGFRGVGFAVSTFDLPQEADKAKDMIYNKVLPMMNGRPLMASVTPRPLHTTKFAKPLVDKTRACFHRARSRAMRAP